MTLTYKLTENTPKLYDKINSLISSEFGNRISNLPDYKLLIAYNDNKVYGVIVYNEHIDTVNILYIVIDKPYRNKGIGTTLLNNLCDKYYNKCIVLTPTKSEKVIKFYKSNGFVEKKGLMIYWKY
jgi:ribosomal protein S18 acetylase RimI-like enzyme